MKVTREDMQLYAVTDTQWLNGRDFYEEIEKVLAAGAAVKRKGFDTRGDCKKSIGN